MLQTFAPQQPVLYEDSGQGFDLAYFIDLIKRRFLYFAIPFLIVAVIGVVVVAIQRPIYRAEGKILVELPEIPPELVRPTVMEVADARIQVIQQRIMTRDNLTEVMNKYTLFPRERTWMSGTELLDLMRSRVEIKPVVEAELQRSNSSAIAFTMSFDYEVPDLARRVANDFLTEILSEDASTRTNSAAETTKFLEREVKRLEGEHDKVVAQIESIKRRPPAPEDTASEELKTKTKTLAELEATLVQKSSVYSDEHPDVKSLKKKIAALKRVIAAAPQARVANDPSSDDAVSTALLVRQETDLAKSLEETNRKLTAARLGESMERGQQAERLQVIEQPSLPQKPVKPKRSKWFAVAFALAALVGSGCVGAAEMLDRRIRGSRELMKIIDRDLIVTLPYLATPGEERRRRRNLILISIVLVVAFGGAIAAVIVLGVSADFSWFDRSWMDVLTRLLR